MSLINKFAELVTETFKSDLAEYLADHLGLDVLEVSKVLQCYLTNNPVSVPPPKLCPSGNTKPATTGIRACQFKITRGAKEGTTCGTTIRGSGDYCSKHKNRKTAISVVHNTKAGCWVIADTSFVVRSNTDKTVIAKLVRNKSVPLTKKDHAALKAKGLSPAAEL